MPVVESTSKTPHFPSSVDGFGTLAERKKTILYRKRVLRHASVSHHRSYGRIIGGDPIELSQELKGLFSLSQLLVSLC